MHALITSLNEFFDQIHWWEIGIIFIGFLVLVAIHDIFVQKRHTIKHNFPVVGHLRYLLEKIGPELRQYIVANNREELPFNRSQRSWIYASSKRENNLSGFGTDQDIYKAGHVFINPTLFPYTAPKDHPNKFDPFFVPCAKVIGLYNKRKKPFRPYSIANISGMSYGSLSAKAVESMNKGALKAGCYQNTGEGALSPYHTYGADVIFHFGTGYFGVRDDKGNFEMSRLVDLTQKHSFIKAIDVKLSQGAKPGKGGILPGIKITPEIAAIRGLTPGKDALSPVTHSVFHNVPTMLDFFEEISDKTGLPVGFKAAVGKLDEWYILADEMVKRGIGPDFITIDGGEGGTGAAPPAFADSVSLPFIFGFTAVYKIFAERGLTNRIVFMASGKLGFPASALMAMSLGADVINVAREAMMSIGCIQAQVCHTNTCPAGVATSNKWLQNGIDPTLKSERLYNYIKTLRKEMLEITHACGYEHPSQMKMTDVEVSMGDNNLTKKLFDVYGYEKTPVIYTSVQDMYDCQYLGGIGKKVANTIVS
ncbi:MAG: FMN-binding glutamate synthase family protein [Opitutaceae bacterium]|nr:FMN-binding glutamate synthase family protein [Cytophagales bacterium]